MILWAGEGEIGGPLGGALRGLRRRLFLAASCCVALLGLGVIGVQVQARAVQVPAASGGPAAPVAPDPEGRVQWCRTSSGNGSGVSACGSTDRGGFGGASGCRGLGPHGVPVDRGGCGRPDPGGASVVGASSRGRWSLGSARNHGAWVAVRCSRLGIVQALRI